MDDYIDFVEPDAVAASVRLRIKELLDEEFKGVTCKIASEKIGIPESNYWRLIRLGKIGGRSLAIIIGFLASRGYICLGESK